MRVAIIILAGLLLVGCSATESHRAIEVDTVQSRGTAYSGPKYRLVIGEFTNRSPYMSGIFSDDKNRLGAQARNILMTHLSQGGRFVLMDRDNMENLATEADYDVSGAVNNVSFSGIAIATLSVTIGGEIDYRYHSNVD